MSQRLYLDIVLIKAFIFIRYIPFSTALLAEPATSYIRHDLIYMLHMRLKMIMMSCDVVNISWII